MKYFSFGGTFLTLAACGDKAPMQEESPASAEQSAVQYDDAITEPEVDPLEAAAIGFEFYGVWNQESQELNSWMTYDANGDLIEQSPYVTVNITNRDFFMEGYGAENESTVF